MCSAGIMCWRRARTTGRCQNNTQPTRAKDFASQSVGGGGHHVRFSRKGDTKASSGHDNNTDDNTAPQSPLDSVSTTKSGSGQLNTYAATQSLERHVPTRDTAPVAQDTDTPAKEWSTALINLRSGPDKQSMLNRRRLTWGATGGADGLFDDAPRSSSFDSFHARKHCWFQNKRHGPGYRSTGITSKLELVLVYYYEDIVMKKCPAPFCVESLGRPYTFAGLHSVHHRQMARHAVVSPMLRALTSKGFSDAVTDAGLEFECIVLEAAGRASSRSIFSRMHSPLGSRASEYRATLRSHSSDGSWERERRTGISSQAGPENLADRFVTHSDGGNRSDARQSRHGDAAEYTPVHAGSKNGAMQPVTTAEVCTRVYACMAYIIILFGIILLHANSSVDQGIRCGMSTLPFSWLVRQYFMDNAGSVYSFSIIKDRLSWCTLAGVSFGVQTLTAMWTKDQFSLGCRQREKIEKCICRKLRTWQSRTVR